MRKPGRGQILENRLVGPREVLGGGDRRVPAKGRGRTAPCRGRSGASWIWATPLTPARARGSSVRATPSLRPPRILKTSLFLQKGGPRKEPSQRTATALFYLIPCGDFQLSPREFYLSLIRLYPIRVSSPQGLSNILLFSVGAFPEVREEESLLSTHQALNDSPAAGQQLERIPVTGRDHWPYCYTAMIAGAGMPGGRLYGESDATASAPREKPVQAVLSSYLTRITIGIPWYSQRCYNGIHEDWSIDPRTSDPFR